MKLQNIQQPTSNIQHPMDARCGGHWMFDVGCWLLDVFQILLQSLSGTPIRKLSARALRCLLLWACLGGSFASSIRAGEAPPLQLLAVAPVSADGIFLPQIFSSAEPLPAVRLADAPAFGKNLVLTRARICELLAANAPGVGTNFSGPDAIKITRRTRTFSDSDLLGLLEEPVSARRNGKAPAGLHQGPRPTGTAAGSTVGLAAGAGRTAGARGHRDSIRGCHAGFHRPLHAAGGQRNARQLVGERQSVGVA